MTQGATSDDEASRGDPALIGRLVGGKYKIEKFLGGGAMGAVYKARQSSLEKNVAVKVMHRAIAVDPSFVGRFHREAKAASRLDHPNSIRVIDFGEEPDGLLYIAMEYVEGRDLYRVIHDDWPISNADLADILMQALAAIAVAHEMGVIHRDLKPENLMILRAKNDEEKDAYLVKVCDFGIAKITEADEESTNTGKPGHKLTTQGLVVGTPEYMSPEQARGEKLDARSDIYAMGIILYQLLTGRTPFIGDTALAVVLKHITEAPEPPATHYPGVHKGLEAVAMRALAKDRNDRFQTARAMRTAIREALDGRPLPASDPAATTAAALVAPSGSLPLAATVPIVITRGGSGPAPAPAQSEVAAVESAPTVAGGMAASHLTPLGTVAAPPAPTRSRVGVVVAIVALVGFVAAVAVAAPRLLEKTRSDDRAKVEPSGTHAVPTSPTPSGSVTPVKTSAVPTGEPAPNESKGPKRAPPVPSVRGTASATSPAKVAIEPDPPAVAPPAVTPAAPDPTPPPAPAFNPQSCRASTGGVRTNAGASPRDLTMNGTAAAWTSCAQRALKERPGGPISAVVHMTFNDSRSFRGASCPACPPPLASCIAASTQPTVSVNFRGGDVTGEPIFSVPITVLCE